MAGHRTGRFAFAELGVAVSLDHPAASYGWATWRRRVERGLLNLFAR